MKKYIGAFLAVLLLGGALSACQIPVEPPDESHTLPEETTEPTEETSTFEEITSEDQEESTSEDQEEITSENQEEITSENQEEITSEDREESTSEDPEESTVSDLENLDSHNGKPVGSLIDKTGLHRVNEAHMNYVSFERRLAKTTDVVKAVYVGTTVQDNSVYYHNFEVLQSLRGISIDYTIQVRIIPTTYTFNDVLIPDYSTEDIPFIQGEQYLLLLRRCSDQYKDSYTFLFAENSLVIPVNAKTGRSFLDDKKTLMYGTPLSQHIPEEAYNAFKKGVFESYVVESIKDNPFVEKTEYIESEDMAVVISESPYVMQIYVESQTSTSIAGGRVTCECRIDYVYKGEISLERVEIVFASGEVAENQSYIVAVQDASPGYQSLLCISSRNSVYSCDMEDEICAIISGE